MTCLPHGWTYCSGHHVFFCPKHHHVESCSSSLCRLCHEPSESSDEGEEEPVIKPKSPVTSGQLKDFSDGEILLECQKRFVIPTYYELDHLKDILNEFRGDYEMTQEQEDLILKEVHEEVTDVTFFHRRFRETLDNKMNEVIKRVLNPAAEELAAEEPDEESDSDEDDEDM